MRLPAVLSSTHAFFVRLQEALAAVSGHAIEDLQYVLPEQLREIGGEVSCQFGQTIYPLIDFGALSNQPADRRIATRGGFARWWMRARRDSG